MAGQQKSSKPAVCLFCCKPVNTFDNINNVPNQRQGYHDLFFTVMERFYGTRKTITEIRESLKNICSDDLSVTCSDCSGLTKVICDLYHQLKCTELQIQCKVDTLVRVMRQANRVPSRLKLVGEIYDQSGEMESFMRARRKLIHACSHGILRSYPKVVLNKLPTSASNRCTTSDAVTTKLETLWFTDDTKTMLLSFAILYFLHIWPSYHHCSNDDTTNQFEDCGVTDDILEDYDLHHSAMEMDDGSSVIEERVSARSNEEDVNVDSEFSNNAFTSPELLSSENIEKNVKSAPLQNFLADNNQVNENADLENICDEFRSQEVLYAEAGILQCKEEPTDNNAVVVDQNKKSKKGRKQKIDKFYCKLCKHAFLTYAQYLSHHKSTNHMRRFQAQKPQIKKPTGFQTPEKVNRNKLSQLQQNSTFSQPQESRYQLRSKSQNVLKPIKFEASSESSSSSSSEDDYDATQSLESDSSSYSSSSHSDSEHSEPEFEKITSSRTGRKKSGNHFYCETDGCKYRTGRKGQLKAHSRLHKPEKYTCGFCEITLVSVFQIAIHEMEQHSKKSNQGNAFPLNNFCPRCKFQTRKLTSYVGHFAAEHLKLIRSGRQTCSICQVKVCSLQKHYHNWHDTSEVKPGKVVKCKESGCKAYFIRQEQLNVHRIQAHKNTPEKYECVVCNKGFETIKLLTVHKKRYHKSMKTLEEPVFKTCDNNIVCTKINCSTLVGDVGQLKEHLRLHGSFKCEFCDTVKKYAPNLPLHEITHQPVKFNKFKYNCQRCSFKTDNTKLYINHHLEDHLAVKKKNKTARTCEICKETYSNDSAYENHIETVHGIGNGKDSKFQCNQCPAYFLHERHLFSHKHARHTNFFKCTATNCDAKFRFKLDLQRHENLHETLPCKFCSKTFDFVENLALHELEHVAENNVTSGDLKCSRCSQRFYEATQFVSHFVDIHLSLSPDLNRCDICEEVVTIRDPKYLKSYTRKLHGSESSDPYSFYRCEQCPAYFTKEEFLNIHTKNIHQENPLICRVCKREFDTEDQTESHEKLHGDFFCKFCQVKKGYAQDLAIHELLQHGKLKENDEQNETYLHCSRCNSMFQQSRMYVKHFIEKHLEMSTRNHRCNICQEEFRDKYKLNRHHRYFHNQELTESSQKFKCEQCPAYFIEKGQLTMHIKKNHQFKFSCKTCGKMFGNKTALERHTPEHEQPDKWKFVCKATGCGMRFGDKLLMARHNRTHSKRDYEFVCDVPKCNNGFSTERECELHKKYNPSAAHYKASGATVSMEEWTKEVISCEICGKEVKRGGMPMHLKTIHLKDRQTEFKCDQCEKEFNVKGKLLQHQEYHKGPEEWKWMCAVCSKRCPTKHHLQSHARTHTKEKPFVCQVCGEKYAHRHNLRNHVNSKHKDEGVQDIAKPKGIKRFYVSRKGKKLGKEFCFSRE